MFPDSFLNQIFKSFFLFPFISHFFSVIFNHCFSNFKSYINLFWFNDVFSNNLWQTWGSLFLNKSEKTLFYSQSNVESNERKLWNFFYKKPLNLSNETFLILNWRLQIITSSRKGESWRSPERERPSRCVRTSWGGSKRISDRDSSRSRRPQSCTRRTGLRSSGFSRILRGCSGRPRGGRRICRKTR